MHLAECHNSPLLIPLWSQDLLLPSLCSRHLPQIGRMPYTISGHEQLLFLLHHLFSAPYHTRLPCICQPSRLLAAVSTQPLYPRKSLTEEPQITRASPRRCLFLRRTPESPPVMEIAPCFWCRPLNCHIGPGLRISLGPILCPLP